MTTLTAEPELHIAVHDEATDLTYGRGVFVDIAYSAVRAVRGVKGTVNGLVGRSRGIVCREIGGCLAFDVSVITRRGAIIHDVCRAIQESIAAAMLKMTSRSDIIVKVSVKGVD
jgi:uncharacterized alkaline shock family protein YloU